ncbi:nucleotide-diphospho-sugar transferase [Hypoxylon rubiginosum]|uniref:Nucleotide-diphospho-sugar transferase n=1 Tax=Hypoxylon rubiginosum TaxID=110542 RepID=A0ACB9Z2N9_9PEZI|nr:nucleotide-diphospho-sugar transferase [Hypoxylon rubiginosum]
MTLAPDARRRYAYATLITRASYLPGVIVLADTLLRRNNASYPLVVLYTRNLSSTAVRALELESSQRNIILHQCHQLLPPGNIKVNLIAERFEDTWTKLRVFELFDYDAVCYLDADMAVYRNMDGIFEKLGQLPNGWLGANHSCVCNRDRDPWAPEDWRPENCAYTPLSHPLALSEPTQPAAGSLRTFRLINGGMLLFRPSKSSWKDMMAFFHTTPLLSEFKFPDQDFLAHFFAGKWKALGWQYNALKTMKYWHHNIWRDEELVCLHYVVDKPWAKRVGEDGIAGYKGRDGITHSWWWEAYSSWERDRTENSNYGHEILRLVRRGVAPLPGRDGWEDTEPDPDMNAIGHGVQAFANNKIPMSSEIATVTEN